MTSPSAIRSYLQEAAGLSWSMDILEFPSPHDLPIVMISERINKITSVRLPDMQAELLEIREDEAALKCQRSNQSVPPVVESKCTARNGQGLIFQDLIFKFCFLFSAVNLLARVGG